MRCPTSGRSRSIVCWTTWAAIRARQLNGAKFRRQYPIGAFIADFVCLEARLVVEIDGGQHADSPTDQDRTRALNCLGYQVVRFWNNEVLGNIEGVLEELRLLLANPSPGLSPEGER